ncbi:MAG: UDP-N-acetylmuramate dehydrogenase [Patescibacteria group bacterium]
MDALLYKKLKEFGKVRANAPLAKHTTLKIGGNAEAFLEVEDKGSLVRALDFLTAVGEDYFVIGGGSNILLPDEVIEGVVIRNRISGLDVSNNIIAAESGLGFGFLTNFAAKNSLSGLEWSAGLPGTVGGAIRGNAGAAGGAVADSLVRVEAWIDGEVVQIKGDDCEFDYRDSIFKHNKGVVLKSWFGLATGDSIKSLHRMQEIMKRRNGVYPPYPSAGSFFKNPSPETPAGKLIEQAGLRGLRVGGAMVSNEHGNFIINLEGATQADVLKLVDEVKSRVYNKFQITLEEEVHIIK